MLRFAKRSLWESSWLKSGVIGLVVSAASIALFNPAAYAQAQLHDGVLSLAQATALAERSSTISQGTLTQLEVDPNFSGDFQAIFNYASNILDGYTIVRRGGGFPENAGIPLDQQLTVAEVVYTIFSLNNGNELILYRSPQEDTSRYFIRSPRLVP
jgi:hypothetical protein